MRRREELTQRELAIQVGYSDTQVSRIEQNQRVPDEATLKALFLPALHIEQEAEWARRFLELARQVRTGRLPEAEPTDETSIPNNLPALLTTFIGREREQTEILQLIGKHRLVTLTGSAGVGKTRISLRVGGQLLGEYPNGVWLAELAPLRDPAFLAHTVATVFGIVTQSTTLSRTELLINFLRAKTALLILDDCEHLIEACARLVNDLLHQCTGLKIIATSREALGIAGEVAYPVPSLGDAEATQLFVDRSRGANSRFNLTASNAPAVAQICSRLDGIPLAIELAAARVKLLSPEQIADRLDDRFRLLVGGSRTALPRQQTLRALIDWSYDLLAEPEKSLLRRLSVFAGSWTLEGAEEVCVLQDDVPSMDVLDLLTQLVNKSLVVVIEQSQTGEARYRMLETIRQYAREKLLEAGDSEIVRDLHLAYFVRLAERAEPELYRSNQLFWLNKLENELDNLRIALEWASATNIESGLRLTASWRFWEARGHIQEMGQWLALLLESYNAADSLRVRALVVYCMCLVYSDAYTQARTLAEQSLQLARSLSDKQGEALSLWGLGAVVMLQGDFRQGAPMVEQSLALYQSLGDLLGEAITTQWLGTNVKDLDRSQAFIVESLRLYRKLGHLSGIANCLGELALRTIWAGDFASPAPWLQEARSICRQLGDQSGEAFVLQCCGTLSFWQGDYQQACIYYEESIVLAEKGGNYYQSSWAGINMAYALLRQGNTAKAKAILVLWIERSHKANDMDALVYAMEGLASLHVDQGEAERAARLFAWADAMRNQHGNHRPLIEHKSVERNLALIRSQIGDTAFENACANGKTMTLEEAIAHALDEKRE